jgi:single-strand DNA-binding protein
MSEGINAVALSGALGADPELRATTGGTAVLTFSLGVGERRRGADGQWTDAVSWIGCTVFGRRAEALGRILRKGTRVALSGKLRASSWERDGVRHKRVEVVAETLDILSRPQGDVPAAGPADEPDIYSEDVPF